MHSRVWHCDPTKNKEKAWIVSPPAEKPFPGVPVAGLSCDRNWKEAWKAADDSFFFFLFLLFIVWTFLPGSLKSRKRELWVPQLSHFFHVSLPFMFVRWPHCFIRLHIRGCVCVTCARAFQRSVKQNSLITPQTVAEQRGLSGEPRPPNCVSHEQSSKISWWLIPLWWEQNVPLFFSSLFLPLNRYCIQIEEQSLTW